MRDRKQETTAKKRNNSGLDSRGPQPRASLTNLARVTFLCCAVIVAASPYQSLLTTSVEWQQLKLGLLVALDSDLSLCPRD
jgi:hypothetical protein